MTTLSLTRFGGMVPAIDDRLLPAEQADLAVNCNLSSGKLDSFFGYAPIVSFGPGGPIYRKAYRFPNIDDTESAWVKLPSEYSSIVRSPLANDIHRRVYWTNPGDAVPWFNTHARLLVGAAPYNLGIVQPTTAPGAAVVGGTATPVTRAYVYTYVNEFGEESRPSPASVATSGAPDGTWTITLLPTTAPTNPPGVDYPPVTQLNLYRTVTGAQTGGQFFRVTTFDYDTTPPPSSYVDAANDTTVVTNPILITTDWGNPPSGLDGITALAGGMLAGFIGNTVHFCEPNRPHTWPSAYDQSVHHDIVGMAVWQQSLVVLTKGYPSVGIGNNPSNFTFMQVQATEPCLARGSIVTDLSGVFYSSQNGLVRLNASGVVSITDDLINPEEWAGEYKAADIKAARHQAQYIAINGDGTGFLVDYNDKRSGVVKLSTIPGATSVWSDEFTGETYMFSGQTVYRWDDPSTGKLTYRWRSKLFFSQRPGNFGACQVMLDPTVTELQPVSDIELVLPDNVNAIFKLYIMSQDGERELIWSRNLSRPIEIFRLPSGFLSFEWQCEVVSRLKIHSVELASTMRELKRAPAAPSQ